MNLDRLTPNARTVVSNDERTVAPAESLDTQVVATIPNPRYPGSPAASREERAAAGWPDIEITMEDLKSLNHGT